MHLVKTEPGLDVSKTRFEIIETLMAAKQSGNHFLVYLLSMALQELTNIENGNPTEF